MTGYHTYKTCIEACLKCAALCNHCSSACLQEDHVKMMVRCIQLCMECAALCYAAAQLMSMGGEKAKELCRICADACNSCAENAESTIMNIVKNVRQLVNNVLKNAARWRHRNKTLGYEKLLLSRLLYPDISFVAFTHLYVRKFY